ncbi:MAG: hypothetical protein JWN33_641 [Candidatus Saccharibacteria bacterium]|nr:hypothetical protein [Candidatus Saccharibacteria bacterium]
MAVNVTFIIGNGLDLSLNLETKYEDFYKFVKTNVLHPENRIYGEINNDPKTWSDFETALGQYTFGLKNLPADKKKQATLTLHEELDEIRKDLAQYLLEQEAINNELPDKYKFRFTASGFYEELSPELRDIITSYLSDKPVYINFITLNYTDTLEKIINGVEINPNYGYRFRQPQHIHGNLYEDLTLGVSDESQLYDGMPQQEKDDLIKEALIASRYDGSLKKLSTTITASSLIVFYGTSIGSTDKYIWEQIINWLFARKGHIIIHRYDDTFLDSVRLSRRNHNDYIRKAQNSLLDHADLSEEQKNSVRPQIFVIHNTTKLFTGD